MKVLVIGARGRMGQKMMSILAEKGQESMGIDFDDREKAENFACDVVVDISASESLDENLALAERKGCPIVIGATGHDEAGLEKIKTFAKRQPVFLSSNFSLMFNIMLELVGQLKILKGCDFVIEETHHKHKKDRPSGSCKTLLKELDKLGVTAQVACFRAGEVTGRHKLSIYGESEILTIGHEATDRKVFCEGALLACDYILSKKVGLYTMRDLIAGK